MATREKSKKRKRKGVVAETLEITGRSVKATGRRTAALTIAAIVVLGLTYLIAKDARTTVSANVSGNNGTAIGQARDVTVNNGNKEAK
jgi:hypothetical protein